MFTNHFNSSEDNEFIRNFPLPHEDDSEIIKDSRVYCRNCKWYSSTTPLLPCAINPLNLNDADNCVDYE